MNAHELQDALKTLLEEIAFMDAEDREYASLPDELAGVADARTFAEAGILTDGAGLVVTTADGDAFQVNLIQSRCGE